MLGLTNTNTSPFKPFHEAFPLHVHSSRSPAGIQQEPLSPQEDGVPQMVGLHSLQALALPVSDSLAVARHLLALDAHLSVNTRQTGDVVVSAKVSTLL